MENPILKLHALGQSLWYDNIQRRMLLNGELAGLIERGELRGMTSNPSIFDHAIAKSTDYDAALTAMAWAGYKPEHIFDELMIEDIRSAADLFRRLYDKSNKGDGYVSVEVHPGLANESDATLKEAQRLWNTVDRPNLMVKIPGTKEGLPAIRQATAAGINVNITLIFSIARYMEVMDAYLSGLEDRVKAGQPIDNIASVASFFVSRIDSKVDKQLEEIVKKEGPNASEAARLMGKAAIANARLAYEQFRKVFGSPRYLSLKEKGARLQRPLWASTSTKNPAYPDTLYVDDLIGPDTVNTVPPQTLDAFRDHGHAEVTIEKDMDQARQVFGALQKLGISIDDVTYQLEVEGVKAFSEAFADLVKTIDQRRQGAVRQLGPLAQAVPDQVHALDAEQAVRRIWEIDPTLWTQDPAAQTEQRKRMGWLTLPQEAQGSVEDINAFAAKVRAAGYTHALLLGMGGSSLAPEVLRLIFRPGKPTKNAQGQADWLNLAIVDSTDPGQVQAAEQATPADRTLYLVSSKSGGTAEVNALLAYFWARTVKAVGEAKAGEHFIAITDPGTSLDKLAHERKFSHVFMGDPEVGGRYSALSPFGLVPAALLGLDIPRLLDKAALMARQTHPDIPAGRNPGLLLGAVMGEAYRQGRDKLTFIADPELAPFVAWIEQLVAESSGKAGKGIVPVDGEPLGAPRIYGKDRLFVYLQSGQGEGGQDARQATLIEPLMKAGQPVLTFSVDNEYDLGGEFFRWEFAIAVACAIIGVTPFDQPDVQDNKKRAVDKIEAYQKDGRLEEGQPLWQGQGIRIYGEALPAQSGSLQDILKAFLAQGHPGDYVALNAYLPRNDAIHALLTELRVAVRAQTGLATTVGFGPRFLHSTGQLHKGGANNGMFLQFTADPVKDVEIPTQGMTFGTLEKAQALGDLESLQARGRRALRIHLPSPDALSEVVKALK